MSSPVDFDEFDLEIQAFGEYLDDISRKINARNYTETLSDPEDEGSSEEAFETPVVNIPPISAQLDDCAINGDDINKPVEVAVDVIPKDADREFEKPDFDTISGSNVVVDLIFWLFTCETDF
uniref:Uncharacterized protein n=1 Tax=Timema monikensis TaxID=170555 RepID=A0A7R9ED58_9NEOP|nr:unnamed protein product [Timema monikensis]